MQSIRKQTQNIVTQEIDALASHLEQQNEGIRALTAEEGQQSRAQILDAVADAAIMHDNAFSSESGKIKATIRDETANSRAHIAGLMETNQEVVKQQINDLQRGLQQLQIEIDRKVEELKDLVVKINTTREGPERQSLKERGNTANVTLISLYGLYQSLQVPASLLCLVCTDNANASTGIFTVIAATS